MRCHLPSAVEILNTAAKLVGGDRDRTHGNKRENFRAIAELLNAYMRIRRDATAELDEIDVGHIMALLKIARTQTGSPNADDWIDGAGYLACAGELSTTSALTGIREAS
jgi:hypothetical protein